MAAKVTRFEIALESKALQQWLQPSEDDAGRNPALKNMGMAIREELSETQRRYLIAYYVDGKKIREIAADFGRDVSTVSRTLTRARARLKKVLRYSSPALLFDSVKN